MTPYALRPGEACHMSDDEYVKWRAGRTLKVTEVQNPITRYVVKLDPPFEYDDDAQIEQFMKSFGLWCEAMWMIGRMSPEEFKAERGWIDANPFWQLARGMTPNTEV